MGARILLTTTVHWPSTARLASAFAGAGAEVDALLPSGHAAAQSRFLGARRFYDPLFPSRSLMRAIGDAQPDLVVPCDDRALTQLLKLAGRFPDLIERSLGRSENYPVLLARGDFMATARALGLPVPRTVAVQSEAEFHRALASLGTPAVLKRDFSWGGDGVAIVRNPAQAAEAWRRLAVAPSRLRSAVRAILRRDAHFLGEALHPIAPVASLQAFVPGAAATSAFACWQGRVLSAIHMDVLETLHPRGPATVLRRILDADMDRAAIRLAEHFGLSGLHGLDFVRDAQGQAQLIEINPRATQTAALALGQGLDLAAALTGRLVPGAKDRPAVTANPVIALFPQEWRRDPASAWLHEAYPDVPWDDPAVLRACLEPGEPSPDRRGRGVSASLTLRQAVGR